MMECSFVLLFFILARNFSIKLGKRLSCRRNSKEEKTTQTTILPFRSKRASTMENIEGHPHEDTERVEQETEADERADDGVSKDDNGSEQSLETNDQGLQENESHELSSRKHADYTEHFKQMKENIEPVPEGTLIGEISLENLQTLIDDVFVPMLVAVDRTDRSAAATPAPATVAVPVSDEEKSQLQQQMSSISIFEFMNSMLHEKIISLSPPLSLLPVFHGHNCIAFLTLPRM